MPTIRKVIQIDASPVQVWGAVSDVGAVNPVIQAHINRGAEVMKETIETEAKGAAQ